MWTFETIQYGISRADDWIMSSRRFAETTEAVKAMADWVQVNIDNGAIVAVRLCRVDE